MLKFFRKHARGWFMLAFMAIIIFVFVLYFGTDRGSQTARAIAIVDGTVITEGEYYNEYNKAIDMARAQYGGELTADMIRLLGLKQATYDSLINRQIIIAKASDLKIQVTDDELLNMITAIPQLQTDGVFDRYKYDQLLRYNKMTDEDFQATQRINLAANKIETIIREGIKLSDAEILDLYAMQTQQMNLEFIQINSADMRKSISPTSDELENYLQTNRATFLVPDQLKVRYIYFGNAAYAPSTIDDAKILDYYNRNKSNYQTKEGQAMPLTAVRNKIVEKIALADGKQSAFEAAKNAHDTIYQEDNFDQYAATNQLKIQSVDFFSVGHPPAALAGINELPRHLSGLQKNEMSRVLTAENGYYLIEVTDKKGAYTPALKNIESNVRKHFIEARSNRMAEEEAIAILASLKEGEKLSKVAQEKGLKIYETGFFPPGTDIPRLGSSPDAMEMLLALSPSMPYTEHPLTVDGGFAVIRLKGLSQLDMKDFEQKKDLYERMLTNIKREEAMKSWLQGNKQAMIKEKRLKINRDIADL
ncbi:MAG: SurA N-terminal domain-containing protein [Smithellaceae bacterium]